MNDNASTPRAPKVQEYDNFWIGTSRVVYKLFPDKRCVFSGVTRGGTSTINAAESIIQEIARREEINPHEYRWFDLQTHLQYGGEVYCPHPGEFEFDVLHIRPNQDPGVSEQIDEHGRAYRLINTSEAYQVERWMPVPCPLEVVEAFREYIGDLSRPAFQCQNPISPDPNRPHGLEAKIRDMEEELLPLFDTVEQLGRKLRPYSKEYDPSVGPRFEAAWLQLRQCLAKDRRMDPQAVLSLDMTMAALDRWADVEFLQRYMLRLLPANIETLSRLAWTMSRTGRYVEAEECLVQATDSAREILRKRKCDLDELLTAPLETAEKQVDDWRFFVADLADVFRRLADVQLQRRRCDQAIVTARQALHLYAASRFPCSDPWRTIGEAQVRLGNLVEARVSLERCLEIHRAEHKRDFGGNPNRAARVLKVMRRGCRNFVPYLDALDEAERLC